MSAGIEGGASTAVLPAVDDASSAMPALAKGPRDPSAVFYARGLAALERLATAAEVFADAMPALVRQAVALERIAARLDTVLAPEADLAPLSMPGSDVRPAVSPPADDNDEIDAQEILRRIEAGLPLDGE